MMTELGQQFERESGHKLTISYGISAQLRAQIEAGARVDLAILTEPVPEQMVRQGYIREPLVRIARVGIRVAMRKGASRPDIGSSDAFRRALLDAKSISYASQSGSGAHFAKVIDRLGIALPPELQDYLVFTGGITVRANEPTAAKALIDFLISPASAAVIRSKGLEPQGSN